MDIESLRIELQKHIDLVKDKWMLRLEDEYGGDIYKLYRENSHELFNDVMPIWELSTRIAAMESFNNLVFIKGSEEDPFKDLKYI